MAEFKEKCVELRKQGLSLNEIVHLTGRAKTSIYFHIRKINLSHERQQQIKEARYLRIARFAVERKGKSEKNFKRFNKWDKSTVSLLSHLMFDGSITTSSCIYNNRNQSLLDNVEKCMSLIYDFAPKKWTNSLTGVNRISYHNVALTKYLKDKSIVLLKEIYDLPVPLKKEFVKAFFDDEGCIDFRPKRNRRQVRGYQKNIPILIIIQTLLGDLEINSRVIKPNEVVISGRENLRKFQKGINFSNGVYINGNRSNSIWKKSLEKRGILDQAIASFKN